MRVCSCNQNCFSCEFVYFIENDYIEYEMMSTFLYWMRIECSIFVHVSVLIVLFDELTFYTEHELCEILIDSNVKYVSSNELSFFLFSFHDLMQKSSGDPRWLK